MTYKVYFEQYHRDSMRPRYLRVNQLCRMTIEAM